MTDSNNNKPQQKVMEIDLMALFRKLYESRKKIYKTIGVGIAIGLIVSFSLPKIYEVKVSLSPESGINGTNGLSGIASMFGLGNASTGFGEDALTFNMFPEIVKTNPFALEMLQIPIQTQKEDSIILYDYLNTEKKPWWSYVMGVPGIKSLFTEEQKDSIKAIDPFRLTPEQSGRIGMLKKVLEVETDKKTNMTKVTVSLQDPLAAAIVADSAVHKLQEYITVTSEKERLQKNLTLAEQIYSQSMGQLQVLRGKLQEAKPVFAVVEPATVPLAPASPKKMLIIIAFAFLAFVLESAWILFGKDIYHDFKNELKKKD